MSNHTPGPWKPCRAHEHYNGTYFDIEPGEEAKYAAKPFVRIEAASRAVASAHDLFEFEDADAHLMAAAPAMLLVLRSTREDFLRWAAIRGGIGTYRVALGRIDAAIALAEGMTPGAPEGGQTA